MIEKWEEFIDKHQKKYSSYETENHFTIISLGLAGETGEVCDLLKKQVRDNKSIREELLLELGDVLHYLTCIAHYYAFDLKDVMEANMVKLRKRHGYEEDE